LAGGADGGDAEPLLGRAGLQSSPPEIVDPGAKKNRARLSSRFPDFTSKRVVQGPKTLGSAFFSTALEANPGGSTFCMTALKPNLWSEAFCMTALKSKLWAEGFVQPTLRRFLAQQHFARLLWHGNFVPRVQS
jgi:hypothetical protein